MHDVSVQHLQQQVVQRHDVLHLHAVQVVHAFVTAHWKKKGQQVIRFHTLKTTTKYNPCYWDYRIYQIIGASQKMRHEEKKNRLD